MKPGRDEAEFRAFVAAFSPTLVRAAVLLVRDPEQAQDTVQTTLERTFRHWRVARRAPEAYSRRVLVNVSRNVWRHRRRHPAVSIEERLSEPVDPSVLGDVVEARLLLQSALAELPELHREVIVTRFFLDLPVEETAALLRVPQGTVKSATHRALARLRELLSDQLLEVHHAE